MNIIWTSAVFGLLFGTAQFGLSEAQAQPEYAPTVQLSGGKVRGLVQLSEDGHKVFEYQGIRYGTAVRFGKPEQVKPWSELYNATSWRDACPQPDMGKPPNVLPFTTQTASEDCLFVNVWTPNLDTANRTVMVWIHGGAFISGTIFTTFYDGRYLASLGDVVVVTVNYRLGAFGFLYGGTADAPGNLAFHDQVLALKWVQANIHHFGGDPSKVTIFGESAGSASVGTLVISPVARGLFHRAIMQSAGPNSHFGRTSKANSLKLTAALAHNLNCSLANMDDTVKCLRTKSMDQILNGFVSDLIHDHLFRPIYGDELIPVKPEEALMTGKLNQNIDLMFGLVRDEGASFVTSLTPSLRTDTNLTVQSTVESIHKMMQLYGESNGEEVAQWYTSKLHNPTQDQLKTAISDAWGDYHIVCPTILFAEQFARVSSKSHFYAYRLMRPTYMIGCTGWMGVCHAEDLIYLFMLGQIKAQTELYAQARDMVHAWTSFAKTGHPGKIGQVQWKEAFMRNPDHSISTPVTRHMALDFSHYQMVDNFYQSTCDTFWKAKIFA